MKKKSVKKSCWDMTLAELTVATKDLDEEFAADKFRPLSPENRARWERMKKTSSNKSATNTRTIAVHVDNLLLQRSEILAKKRGLTRDALFDRALKTVLAADGQ